MKYRRMYSIMVDGAEKAIAAIEAQNFGTALELLKKAELEAEEVYLQTEEETLQPNTLPSRLTI